MEKVGSLLGLFGLVMFAWVISIDRRSVRWRPVLWGVGLQLAFAAAVLLPDIGKDVFQVVDVAVKRLVSFSEMGSDFVFQSVQKHDITIYTQAGQPAILTVEGHISPPLKTLAFWVLPTVMFFSALMAVLYHYGVMQFIVRFFAVIMQKTLGTSGAESLSAAANIFVGQTEAPLIVRPFVDKMTMSELHAVMVGGFATVAGGVMAIYVAIVPIPGIAGHLVTASILSAPAALAVSKLMYPETGQPATLGKVQIDVERLDVNGIDALSRGTLEGLRLFLNIVAMLLVFYAMVMLINAILGAVGGIFDIELSLEIILGYVFAPFALLMGIPWDEAITAGMLLGKKITLTELFAYLDFGQLQASANALSERSAIIMSYALCGFANFASIGIQIGGIGGIAPERRGDLARLGLRAMIGGTLAAMMTGAVAGLFT
ncbi:MAG: NupC/NupG family nucleoside CNT transporter [Deltaproteobacteria bacterium HGW-Deltaproteobacteria-14]|jgi:CNT family concentrative nucleoside transporter|nr:MAG: NupC/NupG family nucleoside CNT transporter [Deltaproteobacteria bacterium HGW-Deltaproteobacteria-14]